MTEGAKSVVSGERVAEWLSRLVRIPSVNPAQAGPRAGEPGEARKAAAVAEWFRELGGEVRVHEVLPGRPNIYATWPGESSRWAAVDVHMDTVSVEQMTGDPFSGEVRDGRVWGRGSVDTQATLAVTLALLEAMQREGRRPAQNLFVAASVDEEVDAQGAPALAAWVQEQGLFFDEMAVAEPTLCGPVVGHKGVLRLEFIVEGVAAHSSQPWKGKNAIAAAGRIIEAFEAEHERLQGLADASPLGAGMLTVTLIQGGAGMNVVPNRCAFFIDRRVVTGEQPAELTAHLTRIAKEACPLPVTVVAHKQIPPFAQDAAAPWVRKLTEWSGLEPTVVPYGTNAWAYGKIARELVVIGPGSIDQAHGAEEWVEISELEKMAGIYAKWWGLSG